MDDFFIFVLGCFTVLSIVGTPIVAIILFVRARRLERKVEALTGEFNALVKLRRAEAAAPQPRAPEVPTGEAPVTTAASTPASPAEEVPAPASAPKPQAPMLFEPASKPAAQPKAPKEAALPAPVSRATKSWDRFKQVDWERWIGVRGAAVVGGSVLALAAILFFVHAFNEGWIKPPMRCAMGVAVGIGCIALGHRLRKKTYAFAPAALEGAGIVALYATIWAADKRYHILSMVASFPLMALVTALACTLAIRNKALLTAVLGLVGGFATPLLLSTGSDRPLPLFGYILLLDLGLLFVGKRREWSIIGVLALLGTFLVEGLWIFGRMGEERIGLGITIVGVFAVLFALAGQWIPKEQRKKWMPAQVGGVLFPFVFAFYFADQMEFRGHVWPNALLLGLLVTASALIGRAQRAPYLAFAGASAGVAVVAVWFFQVTTVTEVCWELSAVAVGLALVSHAFAEWERRRDGTSGNLANAAFVSALGWSLLLVAASVTGERAPLQSVLFGLVGMGALLTRQAVLTARPLLVPLACAVVGLGLGLKYAARIQDYDLAPSVFVAVAVALVALASVLAWRVRTAGKHAWLALFLLVTMFLLALPGRSVAEPLECWFVPLSVLVLALPAAVAAARAGSPLGLGLTAYLTFQMQYFWQDGFLRETRAEGPLMVGFAVTLLSAATYLSLPVLWLDRFRERQSGFIGTSLVGVLWCLALAPLYEERFGTDVELVPYLLLAALFAPGSWRVLRSLGQSQGGQALTWLTGSAAFLLATGLAEQFDHEEPVLQAALAAAGFALVTLWLGREGPGWLANVCAATTAFALAKNALDSGHYERSDALLLNGLTFAHLVPAAALALCVRCLQRVEPSPGLPGYVRRLYAVVPGLGVIVILFAWINLEIVNFYAEGVRLHADQESSQARNVTISIAWGLYAMGLLGLGTARKLMALRWASLALLIITIGKVFLHDLGDLEGLYRVGSLAGLAVSLIVVSLFYQRFVFRGVLAKGSGGTDPESAAPEPGDEAGDAPPAE